MSRLKESAKTVEPEELQPLRHYIPFSERGAPIEKVSYIIRDGCSDKLADLAAEFKTNKSSIVTAMILREWARLFVEEK